MAAAATVLPVVAPAVALAMILWRNRRPRTLHLSRIWMIPALVVGLIGMGLYFTPHDPFGPAAYAGFAAAALLGAAAGYWRGRSVRITAEADGRLTAQATPWGLVFIVVLLGARRLLAAFAPEAGASWGIDAAVITDALLIFAMALVVSQRAEMWIRARRLLQRDS